ncbi:MAG: hypothetical protein WD069_06025 [Planctomycetales bacterium]
MLLLAALLAAIPASAAEFFVAPAGLPSGDGSAGHPWDLATALGGSERVRPGDTVRLAGGTYRGGFVCTLKGTEDAPITIRPVGGARVTVDCRPRDDRDDGQFYVRGDWLVVRDLEFTCSTPQRVTGAAGSAPADMRRGGISSHGSHNALVNLIIHDTNGAGFWGDDQGGEGGEFHGCIIYNNGWKGPDRGHGHALYAQNGRGTKRITDNVMFHQFSHGLHCYGSSKAFLRGFHIEGNVAFQNGALVQPDERNPDFLVGGGTPIDRVVFARNFVYGGGSLRLGYNWGPPNGEVVARDNYIAGGVNLHFLERLAFTGNTVINPGSLVRIDLPPEGGAPQSRWEKNSYINTEPKWRPFALSRKDRGSSDLTFAEWRQSTRWDETSTYLEERPRGAKIFVRPNRCQKGRGHVIVYNWDRQAAVEVDLAPVLAPGQRYRIVSAQDFYGEPVLQGVFDAKPIQLPMTPRPPAQPVGMPDYKLPVTEPEFGVFVVLPEPAE